MFRGLFRGIAKRSDHVRLKEAISTFKDVPILVVGDLILDEYIWGDSSRISPEAPVPVVLVKEESLRLGGAANVANNLKALGAEPIVCGIIGEDLNGDRLIALLEDSGIDTSFIYRTKERPTTVKTRIIARSQQVVRLDRELAKPVSQEAQDKIFQGIRAALDGIRGVIISDYKKGVVVRSFVERLIQTIRPQKEETFISVDPKTGNFECYQGVDILTPNLNEAQSFCPFELITQEDLKRAYELFKDRLGIKFLLITQGAQGMTLFEDEAIYHIPTFAKKVFDVTGAGDTVISTMTLAHVAGLSLVESAIIANIAAGIVVGEVGTSVVTGEELRRAIEAQRPQIPKRP
jgi:D-beta-D-heptose 7-phosphate kinase/D-beta-D-heptose 1-phosphate adenosyltransferase